MAQAATDLQGDLQGDLPVFNLLREIPTPDIFKSLACFAA